MALFKTYRGNRANLPSTKKDGNAYFCIDTGEFFIDYTDASGNLQRKQLNANDAKTVNGHTVEIDVPSDAKLTDTIITVDSALSSTSANPVQNKIINTKFDSIQADIDSKADEGHIHSELVNGNASVVLNVSAGGATYDLSPQHITTYLPESSDVYSYLGTSNNKWDYVYANNINLNGTDLQSTLNSKVPSTRTINGKELSADITLSASDVGALPSSTAIPSIDGLATETYVDNKVAGLVDSAPATLDTLNELAAALGDDPNFATTVATQIGEKVDKVDGKGLSTNDYTTAEKTKLSGIEEGANAYTHPSYTAITGVPTANQTPAFGEAFNISQPVSDATGHITAINNRAVVIPNSTATTSAAGLMSVADKTKLDGLSNPVAITTDEIDAICNATIYSASEVSV